MGEFKVVYNEQIKVIIHKPSGYYNITKINDDIYNLSDKKQLKKNIPQWFENKLNRELIENLKIRFKLQEINFIVKGNEYKGMYVHKSIIGLLISWININYFNEIVKIIETE